MKKISLFVIALAISIMLAGCSTNCFCPVNCYDFSKETWQYQVNTNPAAWINQANGWLLAKKPPSHAVTLKPRIGYFNKIEVDGCFQVQLYGQDNRNSVSIIGPGATINQVVITTKNDTLYISQCPDTDADLSNVTVRIGIANLRSLINRGESNIYGKYVTSDGLSITSCGCGNIFMGGDLKLKTISQSGSGTVTVMGVCSPTLDVTVSGNGNLNISGRVGVRSIEHNGDGDVNIIGADSDSLTISACGCGKTAVAGCVNLKKVTALNNSRVYVYWVISENTEVRVKDNACVGLAGTVSNNLIINLYDTSHFEGQRLVGEHVYVKAHNASYANVTASNKMFAAAFGNSTIYFYNSASMVTAYTSGNGTVIRGWCDFASLPVPKKYYEY